MGLGACHCRRRPRISILVTGVLTRRDLWVHWSYRFRETTGGCGVPRILSGRFFTLVLTEVGGKEGVKVCGKRKLGWVEAHRGPWVPTVRILGEWMGSKGTAGFLFW